MESRKNAKVMEVDEIRNKLDKLFRSYCPPLRIRKDNKAVMELCGTKEAMQGKQKVDGYYFASLVPKPKDIRWYFFPIYTHVDHFQDLSPQLKKYLKGKSCFHLKDLNDELLEEIDKLMKRGMELYQKDDLI